MAVPAVNTTASLENKKNGNQKSILVNFSHYTIARYVSELLFLIRGFLLARVLDPALFGVWTQMKLVLVFLQLVPLGTHEAMLREVPYREGEGRYKRASDIKRNVLFINLLTSALITICLLVLIVGTSFFDVTSATQWILFAAIFPLGQLYWYLIIKLRSEARFGSVGLIIVGFAFLSTCGGVVAASWYGIEGFLLSLGVVHLLVFACSLCVITRISMPSCNQVIISELLRIGLPMMASGVLLMILWNLDKLAIWLFLPTESLGIYVLPTYIVVATAMLPEAASAVLYPNLMEHVAKENSKEVLANYLMRPTYLISYLACPLIGALFLALHFPIQWFLPKYQLSIYPGQILIAAVFFMLISRIPYIILFSVNQQKLVSVITAVSVVVGAIATNGMLAAGVGLEGAALGVALGFFTYGCFIMGAALKVLKFSALRILYFVSLLLAPYVLTVFAVGLVLLLIPEQKIPFLADFAYTSLRCCFVLLVGGVLIWIANSKLRFLRREGLSAGNNE